VIEPLPSLCDPWVQCPVLNNKRRRNSTKKKLGTGVHTYNHSYGGGRDRHIMSSRPLKEKLAISYLRNKV
jgi:hypothetical protein